VTECLAIRAPAKLNLGLRVVGRRADGYHELATIFVAVDLADLLVARRTAEAGVSLELESDVQGGLPVSAGEDNLVIRAGRAHLAASGRGGGLAFRLRKRIPAGAGLGGGSADAAAALVLAQQLDDRPLPAEALATLAKSLGADVPFFLAGPYAEGSACFARGVGERLWPIAPRDARDFVLVLPPFGTSTREVFAALNARLIGDAGERKVRAAEAPTAAELAALEAGGNDLEEPAMRCTPELRRLRDRLADRLTAAVGPDCGPRSLLRLQMSGSGSTLFVALRDGAQADEVAALLGAAADDAMAGVRIVRTRALAGPLVADAVTWDPEAPRPSVSGRPARGPQ
jgi:4-diphosphocytidyl-2-C-methyl-D-erythritol kinase